ncbi:hypothetical protein T484DRAFT_1966078 [Baffinella frigidus]|nr:hypothetical protein T484DRAFT_1966078 [Cryptophyta sp. CCMP2293]
MGAFSRCPRRVQEFLTHTEPRPPWDLRRALGMGADSVRLQGYLECGGSSIVRSRARRPAMGVANQRWRPPPWDHGRALGMGLLCMIPWMVHRGTSLRRGRAPTRTIPSVARSLVTLLRRPVVKGLRPAGGAI